VSCICGVDDSHGHTDIFNSHLSPLGRYMVICTIDLDGKEISPSHECFLDAECVKELLEISFFAVKFIGLKKQLNSQQVQLELISVGKIE